MIEDAKKKKKKVAAKRTGSNSLRSRQFQHKGRSDKVPPEGLNRATLRDTSSRLIAIHSPFPYKREEGEGKGARVPSLD